MYKLCRKLNKEKKNPIRNWEKELNKEFSKDEMKITDRCIFKMFNIFILQGNENQHYFQTSSYPFKIDKIFF